jgi:hypothetical protein
MFKLRQDVYHAQTRHALLDNDITVQVGDLIKPTNDGDIVTNSINSGDYVLGVVVGFCKKNGEVIGQGQDPSITPNQLTTSATNTANEQYHAVYVPITPEMEFSITLDDKAGTTTLSDKAFVWFNFADARTLAENSVVAANGTGVPLDVFSYGLDPEDPTGYTIIGRIAKAITYRP